MIDKKIKKMKRRELLEILVVQSKKIDILEKELKETKEKLNNKKVIISKAGSIAEASLKLNNIFEIAQKTADEYLESIKNMTKSNNKKLTTRIK